MMFKKRQSKVNFSFPPEERIVPISIEEYTPKDCQVDKQWITELGLKLSDRETLCQGSWLTDNIVNAAQKLLKLANPAVPRPVGRLLKR